MCSTQVTEAHCPSRGSRGILPQKFLITNGEYFGALLGSIRGNENWKTKTILKVLLFMIGMSISKLGSSLMI